MHPVMYLVKCIRVSLTIFILYLIFQDFNMYTELPVRKLSLYEIIE